MTRKEALSALIAEVEAGELPDRFLIYAAFPEFSKHMSSWPVVALIYWIMDPDDIRAMGAAKALHEAVLPGWTMDQMNQWHEDGTPRGWAVHLLRHKPLPKKREQGSDLDNPARAWLLAILKALYSMEMDND